MKYKFENRVKLPQGMQNVFIYQVHVSTKHQAEKKAQQGHLMGTSD